MTIDSEIHQGNLCGYPSFWCLLREIYLTERLPDWIFFVVSKITSVAFHKDWIFHLLKKDWSNLMEVDGFMCHNSQIFNQKGPRILRKKWMKQTKTWGTFCILHKLTIFLGYKKNCCLIPWRFKEFLVASIDFLQKNGTCRVFLALHHWTAMENGKCGLKKPPLQYYERNLLSPNVLLQILLFWCTCFLGNKKWLLNLCIAQVLVAFCFQSPERFFCVALRSSRP